MNYWLTLSSCACIKRIDQYCLQYDEVDQLLDAIISELLTYSKKIIYLSK